MASGDEALAQRVRAAASAAVEAHHLPGICVGVVRGDDLVFAEGFGYADIESRTPADPGRRQPIASITKTMVGLCAMALVDEGKLRLGDRVARLLPDVRFNGPGDGITVWNLLTHTSGIGEAPTRESLLEFINPDRAAVADPGGFDTLYPEGIVVEVEPGTKWCYCNHGYALLGEIIVRLEGAPIAEVLSRRLWEPLGMGDTDIRDEPDPRLSTGYHRAPREDARQQLARAGHVVPDETPVDGYNIRGEFRPSFNRGLAAVGGAQSTIADMARYAAALLRGGAAIVRPATFTAMIAPQHCPDPRLTSWGLSFERTRVGGLTGFGHGGAFFGGWNSQLTVVPEHNLAVLQHMNLMYDDSHQVFAPILRAALDVAPPVHAPRAVDAALLESAPGVYSLRMPGTLTNLRPAAATGRIHIERDGSALMLRSRWGLWKNGVRLVPCDDGDPAHFAVEMPGLETRYLSFERAADGKVAGLRFDQLVHMIRDDRPAEGAP